MVFFILATNSLVLGLLILKLANWPDSFVVKRGVLAASTISGVFIFIVPPTAVICCAIVLPTG